MDTWIRILTHMHSSRRHWPCGDSGTMRISLPIDQHTFECHELLCRAPLNGGNCICKEFSPLRDYVGELIGDITCTSNLGNLAMEVMDDLLFFFVLGNVATEMIGDDRPYSSVLGTMSSLIRSLGMVPKLTYNNIAGLVTKWYFGCKCCGPSLKSIW